MSELASESSAQSELASESSTQSELASESSAQSELASESSPQSDPKVTDVPERSRFEIEVDGELAGFAEYRANPGRITFTHTEIDEKFGGKGLAGILVRTALDSARERGLAVTPLCPYVRRFIAKHPEYIELVPEGQRERFELV